MLFIEHLTAVTWLFYIIPRLIVGRNEREKTGNEICYYFDGSGPAVWIARATAKFFRVSIEQFKYKIHDVLDDNGMSTFLKVHYLDSIRVENEIRNDRLFGQYLASISGNTRFPYYLQKSLHSFDMFNSGTYDHLLNAQMLILVCTWKYRKEGLEGAFLFLRRRLWFPVFEREAVVNGIALIATPRKVQINLKNIARRFLPPKVAHYIQSAMVNRSIPPMRHEDGEGKSGIPRLATEYYGHLNLDHPERYSDLFFFQRSDLTGKDIVLLFSLPSDPLDIEKNEQLKKNGIQPIALSPAATRLQNSTVYDGNPTRKIRKQPARNPEIRWMNQIQGDYEYWRSYWAGLFERYNIRVYTTWLKYDSSHFAIADAMDSLGGITTIYQRSYQTAPIPSTTMNVDIAFSFSPDVAQMEEQNNSRIKYLVTTGYIGDHRFPLLREKAGLIRGQLKKNGARHILAYFDENTVDDARWYLDHSYARDNYAFLLEKVLQEPSFGLLLKPKNPGNLLRRLGPVAPLMERALATGRCSIFLDGAIQGSDPPALAALCADVAVHDGITSPTAGMESALCGIPTLLLDREGWAISNLYRLGNGSTVFQDWERLWGKYVQYIGSGNKIQGFGDWSPLLAELDPFRDGRAAERIGTYLKWLLDGFKAGEERDNILAQAAERYCRQWGYDKISTVP
ncbi:MAG: hypothetical protein ACYDHW_08680 [Syntrophorhabdaceae bacterium]